MADNDVTRIAGNIGAMNALYSLTNINKQLSIHQTRLATGKRINSAADDPAGLALASKMLSRSEGLKTALSNIGDAKNLLAVTESGLGRLNDILIQMRNKAEQAASDTMGTEERDIVKEQLTSYANQINDIVAQTKWGSASLIDGATGALTFQTGSGSSDKTTMASLDSMKSVDLGLMTAAGSGTTAAGIDGYNPAGGTGITASSGAATVFANANAAGDTLAPIVSGEYQVTLAFGAQTTGVGTVTAQLWKDGVLQQVDNNGVDDATNTFATSLVSAGYDTAVAGKVLDFGNGLSVTLGAGMTAGNAAAQTINFTSGASALDITGNTAQSFNTFMDAVDTAMSKVNNNLSKVGSLTGSLTFKEDQISASQINIEASYNRIMNANMAEEQVNASKLLILQQTSTAMLAQANAAPQFLLSLFK